MADLEEHHARLSRIPNESRRRRLHNQHIVSFLYGIDQGSTFRNRERCLEIGCGFGLMLGDLAEKYGIIPFGIDACEPREGESVPDGVDFRVAKAEQLPFETGTFQSAVSYFVLPYVPDRLKAVSEVHRVLAVGGVGILDFDNAVSHDSYTCLGSENTFPGIESVRKQYDPDEQLSVQSVPILSPLGRPVRKCQRVIVRKKSGELKFPELKSFKTKPGNFPLATSYY